MTRKLILDLDTGIDDTLAIAYALASEQADDVRLIGITGTYGNVIRLLPPLVISEELLLDGLEVLEAAVRKHA